MKQTTSYRFSEPVSHFRESRLPETAALVGYAALIDAFNLRAPLPEVLCAIGSRHKLYEQDGWCIYTPRHEPVATLEGHLVFALKFEGVELAILKRLFQAIEQAEIVEIIKAKPSGSHTRRIWFLYEWLLGQEIDIPNARKSTYVDVVNSKLQFAVDGVASTRHRVQNNLPGTPDFCPLVRRTPKLDKFIDMKLDVRARKVIEKVSNDVLARTASFLLLEDSKASYVIEGESPPHDRIQRWGRAIGEAGKYPLDGDEFLRLQKIVIGEDNFLIDMGFRNEGGFIGKHDHATRMPLPDHISARHEDLPMLVRGLVAFGKGQAVGLDPVIAAAILAFGFVYIHPFVDGNGRIHRYLIHHVLSTRNFNPKGLVFPVSAAILARISDYRQILESYSARLLPEVEWQSTSQGNVEVLNDTGDFYRYFDATQHSEFLFECVQSTIERDLPEGTAFLERYDKFKVRVDAAVEMPASMTDLLFNFLNQNDGRLSKRARSKVFSKFTDEQAEFFETTYRELFSENHTPL